MSRLPKPVSGCDIRSLPLTPADAFLLSRVDGTATEHDLALCTGLPPEQVVAMLDRLAALGIFSSVNFFFKSFHSIKTIDDRLNTSS